jgi:hypothetical protein
MNFEVLEHYVLIVIFLANLSLNLLWSGVTHFIYHSSCFFCVVFL